VDGDAKKGVAFQRPLCPYPQVAMYNGSGDVNAAASFACVVPK
jgi:feruloyl esterase